MCLIKWHIVLFCIAQRYIFQPEMVIKMQIKQGSIEIEQYGIDPADSLEGYLFPDTYHLVKSGGSEVDLVEMMVKRALQVWDAASDAAMTGLLAGPEPVDDGDGGRPRGPEDRDDWPPDGPDTPDDESERLVFAY